MGIMPADATGVFAAVLYLVFSSGTAMIMRFAGTAQRLHGGGDYQGHSGINTNFHGGE